MKASIHFDRQYALPSLYYHNKANQILFGSWLKAIFLDLIISIAAIIPPATSIVLRTEDGNYGTTTYPVATPLRVRSGVRPGLSSPAICT